MLEEYLDHIQKLDTMLDSLFEATILAIFLGVGFLAIKFITVATGEGMIFGRIAKLGDNLPEWITKPLYGCEYCMASVVGTVIYLLVTKYGGLLEFRWLVWIGFCVCLSGYVKVFDEKRERVNLIIKDEPQPEPKPLNGVARNHFDN